MDISFLNEWLKKLGEAICELPDEQRETLLYRCAKNCANTGIKDAYLDLYHQEGDDLDAFFQALNSWEYVGGQMIESGKTYEIIFKHGCMCDLYTQGYIQEP